MSLIRWVMVLIFHRGSKGNINASLYFFICLLIVILLNAYLNLLPLFVLDYLTFS